ncbi:MAG: TIGR01212 family radical SAM protein [Oscillospiraceae bacterium]
MIYISDFIYSDDNKRYHTLNYYFQNKFNCKVFKVSLNAGFTCPNIDGSKGRGGCIYCSSSGSGDFAGNPKESLMDQFNEIKNKMHLKWVKGKYIAYFQAFTNTYAPLDVLKAHFEYVLTFENVIGISISTRPDCLPDDIVDYLYELSQRTFLIVELGLQTMHNDTGVFINRCHGFDEFLSGYKKLSDKNINVSVHIINGLPYETKEMMLETVKNISNLNMHSIKIHLLHILKGTTLAKIYSENPFKTLSLNEYVDVVCDQIEILPANTVIQRVTGDGGKDDLIAPLWSLKKFVVINEIDKELKRRNSYQGIYYKG